MLEKSLLFFFLFTYFIFSINYLIFYRVCLVSGTVIDSTHTLVNKIIIPFLLELTFCKKDG